MKYYVFTQGDRVATVEADTDSGAEYALLDLDGIVRATAICADPDRIAEIKTDVFRGLLIHSETISLDELKRLSAEYRARWQDVTAANEAVKAARDRISALERELELAQSDLNLARNERSEAAAALRRAMEEIRLPDNYDPGRYRLPDNW